MEIKREELINVVNDFYNERNNYVTNEAKLNLYIKTLNKIEEILLKYECSEDYRFVTFGRRDFLKKELTISLENKELEQAFYDIIDYVKADTYISHGTVPSEYNYQEIVNMDNVYKNSGIICKQEQEILLEMIKEFKNKISNNTNQNTTNSFIEDEMINIVNLEYSIEKNIRKEYMNISGLKEGETFHLENRIVTIDKINRDTIILKFNNSDNLDFVENGLLELKTGEKKFLMSYKPTPVISIKLLNIEQIDDLPLI